MTSGMSASRLARRRADLRTVQHVAARIEAFNATLDAQIAAATRPEERLLRLRDATNQITRAANDAIQAYRRVASSIRDELAAEHGAKGEAEKMQRDLQRARADMLRVLEVASRRYPWAAPWRPDEAEGTEGPPSLGVLDGPELAEATDELGEPERDELEGPDDAAMLRG
jgi:hypothetical protein